MSEKEQRQYNYHETERRHEASLYDSTYVIAQMEGRKEGLEVGLEKGREEGLEKGREEGLEKGREEGLEKGREEGKQALAKNLLDFLDDKAVAERSGLSVASVVALRATLD